MKKEKDPSKSISGTYFSLRVGLAGMAFFFPILLLIGGCLAKVPIQGSITIMPPCTPCLTTQPVYGVMRDLFVGTLCAIGVILVVYGHHYT
jgi:hypothetical protein